MKTFKKIMASEITHMIALLMGIAAISVLLFLSWGIMLHCHANF